MSVLYFLFFLQFTYASPKITKERIALHSSSLGKTMHYTLWIPEGTPPKDGFPLLVMLHGLGDTDINWSKTHVLRIYQQVQQEGLAPHMVLVPNGERGYWVDQLETSKGYASWVMEAIYDVEAKYRISKDPGFRSIMGLSMGAWGALSIGLQHPEDFGQIIAMSPTDVFLAIRKSPSSSLYTTAFGDPVHPPFVAHWLPLVRIATISSSGGHRRQRQAPVS